MKLSIIITDPRVTEILYQCVSPISTPCRPGKKQRENLSSEQSVCLNRGWWFESAAHA